jgi:hypothetical protein
MKAQFVSNSTRVNLVKLSMAVALLLNLSTGSAQSITNEDEPSINIKYTGLVEDKAQFQFDFANDSEQAFLLTIQEEDGVVLYKEKIDRKSFTKRFLWDKGSINASKLIFSVTGLKSKKTQAFEVNTEVRTIQDVVISKL